MRRRRKRRRRRRRRRGRSRKRGRKRELSENEEEEQKVLEGKKMEEEEEWDKAGMKKGEYEGRLGEETRRNILHEIIDGQNLLALLYLSYFH